MGCVRACACERAGAASTMIAAQSAIEDVEQLNGLENRFIALSPTIYFIQPVLWWLAW